MIEPARIAPEATRKKVLAGTALLVCAYERDDKFSRMHLEGALSLREFKHIAPSLPKEREIIFYCA
jgi:rhodanese-related sulfurtransferase